MKTTKKAYMERIRQSLLINDKAVVKALQILYSRQTLDERAVEETVHHNNVGFRSCDANFLSSLAEQYNRKGFLSPRQMDSCRKLVVHYVRQLYDHARHEGKVEA